MDHCCFFYVKSRTTNTQKLKFGIKNVYTDGPIKGYVKICDNSLTWPQGAIYT